MKTTNRLRMRWAVFLLVLVVAVLAMIPRAAAQSIFASVVGTVADSTGAVVPGAKVTMTNVRTNEKRQFPTDAAGNYETPCCLQGKNYRPVWARSGRRGSSFDFLCVSVPLWLFPPDGFH